MTDTDTPIDEMAEISPEAQAALGDFVRILGVAKLVKAADELRKLAENGYGEIYITLHDHRVVNLKVTNSYK